MNLDKFYFPRKRVKYDNSWRIERIKEQNRENLKIIMNNINKISVDLATELYENSAILNSNYSLSEVIDCIEHFLTEIIQNERQNS